LIASPKLAGEAMGWEPRVDLEEGLTRVIAYIDANRGRYRVEDYAI
jgi:nucleoside-diphosphate-sugar epimerase